MPYNKSSDDHSHEAAPENTARTNCHFTFGDGRRCRMTRSPYCISHSQHDKATDDIISQIFGQSGEMITMISINRILRNLFVAVLRKRISARDSAALARLCGLLLHTLNNVEKEFRNTHGNEGWMQVIETAISAAEKDDPDSAPIAQKKILGLLSDGDPN
jgi:hypothetical protein